MAMEELKLRGIPFDKVDLEEIEKSAAEVTGRKVNTVPQIYIEGEYVGGYDDLMAMLNNSNAQQSEECRACEG
jgi:glutaredoxin